MENTLSFSLKRQDKTEKAEKSLAANAVDAVLKEVVSGR